MIKPILTGGSLVLFVAALAFLEREGTGARVVGEPRELSAPKTPVRLVGTTAQVYALWKEGGFRGRQVVNLGRHLHFVEIGSDQGFKTDRRFPLEAKPMLPSYEAKVGRLNFLWVAAQAGIAREVHHVLPPDTFLEKRAFIAEEEEAFLASGDDYVLQYFGSLRVLARHLPAQRESVLLNIDASYFRAFDAQQVVSDLRAAGLRSDLVTLCLSEDSEDVSALERARLLWAARLLAEQ